MRFPSSDYLQFFTYFDFHGYCLWENSGSGFVLSPRFLPAPPRPARRPEKDQDPYKQARPDIQDKDAHIEQSIRGGMVSVNKSIANPASGGPWSVSQLRLVFFRQVQINGREGDTFMELFLVGLHDFDFAADARHFLFHFQNVTDFTGARAENFGELRFRLAGVLEARVQVHDLRGHFLARLLRLADATKRPQSGERNVILRGGNGELGIERTRGALLGGDT